MDNQTSRHQKQQYDKIRVLGKGSFGTAVVHRRRADCSLVVLKEIDLQQFRGDKERSSALNEARIMSSLDHVNIIKYYNAYTTETKLLIEMEYASMGTLANYLSLQTNPLNEQEILVIFKQIVAGLSYLHDKQIVHLDLKTANIFVTIDGLVKIGDFGIAQYMQQQPTNPVSPVSPMPTDFRRNSMAVAGGSSEMHRRSLQPSTGTSQHFAGTLSYSSPERCMGDPTDFKSDIWSLGCILYELITSRPMFAGDNLAELVMRITRIQYAPIKRNNISPELKRTFEQTICLRPEQRPSASELLEMIERLSSIRQQATTTAGQQHQQRQHTKLRKRQNHGLDLSTDAAAYMVVNNNAAHDKRQDVGQLRYPHSLIYQVRLDSRHIQIDRVNLPLTKRIKEICKGKSHYLALTYDNIVFGWGSRSHGELGSCGLSCSSSARLRASWTGKPASSSASNTKPFSPRQLELNSITNTGQLECLPLSSPKAFIINELNHRKIVQTAAGNDFSVFLSKTGIVMTCGDGIRGCLGRGNFKSSFTPCMVESLLNTDIVSIASGPEHVVAICGNGKAFAWGNSSQGRLGIGARSLMTSSVTGKEEGGAGSKYVAVPHPVRFAGHEEQVFVRSAFCGDRCTIFIDAENRCWACGENRSNRLGLDVRRRFKKTLIVDRCWQPVEITALSKYQIVSCNIGKNHTTFITRDGKLLVYGQDIDQTYKLRSNIMNGIQSHRRISFELQTTRRRMSPPRRRRTTDLQSIKKLTKSTVMNNQSSEFKQSKEDNSSAIQLVVNQEKKKYPRYSLTKLQRQQVDSYLKKSRATKKMPFECVIASSCTNRFTLALTNDNRVYFWGTRSHVRDDLEPLTKLPPANQTEPQLVPAAVDECFVKIGATNRSLMNTIQTLGSDQPIVHGQDPRLTANTLADLWILDYELSSASSSSSSSISSSTSSLESHTSRRESLAESSGCCSSCCSLKDHPFSTHKHDAILDPQPIVSLYVPSMFNHSGCSLQLVDLFCFDEDKFYLVLDTTVKMHQLTTHASSQQQQQQQQSSSSARSQQNARDETNGTQLKLKLNSTAAAATSSGANKTSQTQTTRRRSIDEVVEEANERPNRLDILDAIQESPRNTSSIQNIDHVVPQRSSCCAELLAQASRREPETSENHNVETTATSTTDDNNNLVDVVVESDAKTDLTPSTGGTNPCSGGGGGVGGNHSLIAASLDEPRSMSTFVANSVGNQIIVGPSMRLAAAADQNMEPLRFSDSPEEKSGTVDDSTGGETTLAGDCDQVVSSAIKMKQNPSQGNMMNRRKSRQLREKSESTTTSCTCNETSPMPSWVRNEYDMQQEQQHPLQVQQCDDDDGYMFAVDSSSATEGTCITERPLFDDNGDLTSIAEPEEHCQCTEQTPRNSSAASSIANIADATKANDDMGALANLASSFLSRSQPDIRLAESGTEREASSGKQADHAQLQVETLSSRRSFATLDEDIKLDTSSIVRQNNLLDCDVYRNQKLQNGGNNCLQTSTMNMSGLSTRSSSNNPLIGSPSLVRKNASELPLGGLNGRYRGTSGSDVQRHRTAAAGSTAYLWPSNSNLHDGLQRSSSSINEMKFSHRLQQQQQQQQQLHLHQTQSLCKSVQQLNAEQTLRSGANGKRANGSVTSITSSLRKSLLKLFC